MPNQERVAIVTGASSGIGQAVVRRFAREGIRTFALARNRGALEKEAAAHGAIIPWPCDVRDGDRLQACVDEAMRRFGRLDIVVNNAGFQVGKPVEEVSLAEWRDLLAVNLDAYFLLIRAASVPMRAAGYGRIVNVSSTQSIASEPFIAAYSASKGAINALTRTLAVELAPHGILVNAVAPGCIHTPMSVINGVDETTTPLFQEWYVQRRKIPLGRPGRADEVADLIHYLSGDQCTYITGQVLVADGGLTVTF